MITVILKRFVDERSDGDSNGFRKQLNEILTLVKAVDFTSQTFE
jgi:hypothetical protein